MQLSRHDLSQLDEAALGRLDEERLRALSQKLLADLKAAYERLDQNSRNSSRPPSSEPPWQGQPKELEDEEGTDPSWERSKEQDRPDRDEQKSRGTGEEGKSESSTKEKPARRPGQQPGAPGHGRTQTLPIDHEEHHHPERCALCGAAFQPGSADRIHSASLAIDLRASTAEFLGLQVVQSKHVYHESACTCGHWTRAEPGHCEGEEPWRVALSERHLVGPMLVALLCALSFRMRLSRRRIQEFLGDWLGLQLAVATINQCLHEAGRALEPVLEEQLRPEMRAGDLIHADETSWKEHGQLLWLWVFTTATTTLFAIGHRSQDLLYGVLGPVLNGWLMSDGYWAYRDYENRLRCLTIMNRGTPPSMKALKKMVQL